MTTFDDAHCQLVEFGLNVDCPITDGRIHKAKYAMEKRPSGWYVLHEKNNLYWGKYGCYKVQEEGFSIRRRVGAPLDSGQFDAARKAMRERAEKELKLKKEKQQNAKIEANRLWATFDDEGESDYLKRKKVKGLGVKYSKGSVIVPLCREGELRSLQAITKTGFKKYLPGGEVSGCYHLIKGSGPVALCEGYSTGATIHMATGWHVAVCFTASNLPKVAPYFRRKETVICADDDFSNEKNVGQEMALRAKKELGAVKILTPTFRGERGTDWNDLHVNESLIEVIKQCRI